MGQEYTWISRCLITQPDPNGIVNKYTIQIACNASDDIELHRRLRDLVAHQPFSLESIEYSRLIQDHLDRMDYYDQASVQLASESAQHGYALGPLEPVENASADINTDGPSYLHISHSPIKLEYDYKKPSWQQPWIDPVLKDTLFRDNVRTYLLTDATSRNLVTSTFDLDDYDEVTVRSLYSGDLAKELKHHAPYLIDITLSKEQLSDDNQVPKFHRDFFSRHWGKNTGILLHSSESIDKVVFHLKKFIKIQNNQGQWFFFRFFDPRTMNHYLQSIQRWPQRVAKWYGANTDNELIQTFFCEAQSGTHVHAYQILSDHQLNHTGKVELTDAEFQFFQDYQWQHNKQLIEQELRQDFPSETQQLPSHQINDWCEQATQKHYTSPRAIYDYCYSALMAQTHGFDLSEVEQYLAEQNNSHLEKSKLLYQSTKDAVERYITGTTH